jgi:hypothetical protein
MSLLDRTVKKYDVPRQIFIDVPLFNSVVGRYFNVL